MHDDFPEPPKLFDRWVLATIVGVGLFALYGFASIVS